MDEVTIRRLNAINRSFYRVTATEFDQTRSAPWPGWERLLPHLQRGGRPLSVLDVGCGNGRFGVFLAERLRRPLYYHGVDNNPTLLSLAEEAVSSSALGATVTVERRDVVESPPDAGEYDLVALFGVIHHVPGYAYRRAFMRTLAGCLDSGGMLAFACWRFYEYERFRERIVPWPDDLAGAVETHDFLLDWRRGEVALRYCHYIDDGEHAALVTATGLQEVETYRADGFTGEVNRYSLLKRP